MLAGLRQLLRSPAVAPISLALALMLAVALGVYASVWEGERQAYETRILELSRAAERTQASLRTQLTACHAQGRARDAMEAEFAQRSDAPGGSRAQALLAAQPEGIDACARMESADRAVLSNLKP
ncbi:hypothetical protein WDZ92_35505 [Nostoc sp. NIES-2111]